MGKERLEKPMEIRTTREEGRKGGSNLKAQRNAGQYLTPMVFGKFREKKEKN